MTVNVAFMWSAHSATREAKAAYTKALGGPPPLLRGDQAPVRIICTAEQFGLFMIYRNELGGTNTFKQLNPRVYSTTRSEDLEPTNSRANEPADYYP